MPSALTLMRPTPVPASPASTTPAATARAATVGRAGRRRELGGAAAARSLPRPPGRISTRARCRLRQDSELSASAQPIPPVSPEPQTSRSATTPPPATSTPHAPSCTAATRAPASRALLATARRATVGTTGGARCCAAGNGAGMAPSRKAHLRTRTQASYRLQRPDTPQPFPSRPRADVTPPTLDITGAFPVIGTIAPNASRATVAFPGLASSDNLPGQVRPRGKECWRDQSMKRSARQAPRLLPLLTPLSARASAWPARSPRAASTLPPEKAHTTNS
jgi:hypothetical protein